MLQPQDFVEEYNRLYDSQFSSYDCNYSMMYLYALEVLEDYKKQTEEKEKD